MDPYVEQVLAPTLKPSQVVVLDNLSVQKGDRVRQATLAKGCQVLFLPAYSPDLAPVDEAFSKVKAFLRRAEAHTRETLTEAIGVGLETVTAQDVRGWFRHCGYPVQVRIS